MPAELVIMIIAVTAMSMGTGIVMEWMKTKRKLAEANALKGAAGSDEILARLDAITRRLTALETIVTDEDRALSGEIEALRRKSQSASI